MASGSRGGLGVTLSWDDDHVWSVPAGFQHARFAILTAVFGGLAGLGLVVTLVLLLMLQDARALLGLVFVVAFGTVAVIVHAVGRRLKANLHFAFSRTRGYHDGTRWHPWSEVRRVSVSGGVVHTVVVDLPGDVRRRHLVGQVGYGRQTRDVATLLPSFVPPDRLVVD